MAISNELLSSTLYSIRDTEVDQLFEKVAFLDGVKKAGGIEKQSGGIKIQRPLSFAEHSSITQHSTGYEPVSLAVADVLRPAVYEWCDFTAPIVISKKEEMENSGEHAIVKILEARMRSVMGMLRREFNKQILVGSSSVLSNLSTLNGESTVTANGFLEAAAVGAQGNTVGGVSKTGAPVGWQNQAVSYTAGSLSMDDMYDLYVRANAIAPMGDLSHVIMASDAFREYRSLLFAQEQYVDASKLDGGRMGLAFNGAIVEHDPSLGTAGTTDGNITAYFLNYEGIKLVMHNQGDFEVSPFEHIPGTSTRAAQLYVKAQVIADHLGCQGVLYTV